MSCDCCGKPKSGTYRLFGTTERYTATKSKGKYENVETKEIKKFRDCALVHEDSDKIDPKFERLICRLLGMNDLTLEQKDAIRVYHET